MKALFVFIREKEIKREKPEEGFLESHRITTPCQPLLAGKIIKVAMRLNKFSFS